MANPPRISKKPSAVIGKTVSTQYEQMMETTEGVFHTGGHATRDWTNVNAPATSLAAALKAGLPQAPPCLYDGVPVQKVTQTGSTLKRRILTLSEDHLALFVTHQRVKSKTESVVAAVASSLPIPLWTPSKGFAFTNSTSLQDRYVRYIDVADVDAIQVGVMGTLVMESISASHQKKINPKHVVTVFHHGFRSLNMVISNDAHRAAVVDAIRRLHFLYTQAVPWIHSDALLLRYIWYDVDADQSGWISRREFETICHRINLDIDGKKAFNEYVAKKNMIRPELPYEDCMQLLQQIKAGLCPTIPIIWNHLFGTSSIKGGVNADIVWRQFLQEMQGETNTTVDDAKRLIQSLQQMDMDQKSATSKSCKKELLTLPLFEAYLLSKYNAAYDPVTLQEPAPRDLSHPISEYWINTSHNTYLTGDQLQSRSSVEAYVLSLMRGCKCLELDCWDGNNQVPVVFHGHTLTSKIPFRSILLVVQNYLQSHPRTLPIILSLENHCSHPFQKTMAFDLKEVFGSALYVPTHDQMQKRQALPSPEEMRGKIVIKGKRPPEPDDKDESTKAAAAAAAAGLETSVINTNKPQDYYADNDETDPYDEALQTTESATPKSNKKKKVSKKHHPKIVPQLAKLTLFHGTKYKSFETSIAQDQSHMHSIGETKIGKILDESLDNVPLWKEYNQAHMTRTYPAGFRVDSSNYLPITAWAMGCQLVALNFQTHDTPLLLNDGRFRQAGGCGYVRKPPSVMKGIVNSKSKPQVVQIQILSGHCLPKPKGSKAGEDIDPYIRVELHDMRQFESSTIKYYCEEFKTSAIHNNGFCPAWTTANKKKAPGIEKNTNLAIFSVKQPDVAMILFQVLDEDMGIDDKIASAAIPVNCLRSGYRSIQLYEVHTNTRTGPFQMATLLVKIDLEGIDEA